MTDWGDINWNTCVETGCIGARLASGERCWAHADPRDLDAQLKKVEDDGHVDAQGTHITTELLERILAAAPRDDDFPILTSPRFRQATFHGDASFGRTFKGIADFTQATFNGFADFRQATFDDLAYFGDTTFNDGAAFSSATFKNIAWFGEATFNGRAEFTDASFEHTSFSPATFNKEALFDDTTFNGAIRFDDATFNGTVRFDDAIFKNTAGFAATTFIGNAVFESTTFDRIAIFSHATFKHGWFQDAIFNSTTFFDDANFEGLAVFIRTTFNDDLRFRHVSIRRDASFDGAQLKRARQLGPVLVRRSVTLDRAVFFERVVIELSAPALCCRHTRFLEGVQMRVRWADVVLDDADLAAPSTLSDAPPFSGLHEERWARAWRRLQAIDRPPGRPRLLSLRRADVAGLTIGAFDLRPCRFAGAHHLDQLQVSEVDLAKTPPGWRWTNRKTLAEEHHWRAARQHYTHKEADVTLQAHKTGNWYGRPQQPPKWLHVESVGPAQIAALYRSLRKGSEDSKDEPGAADFYYGEMEMRRNDPNKPWAERSVLFVYWLSSGYALRASRAFAWLLAVLAATTVLLAAVGLDQTDWSFPARLGTAVVVTVEGAVFRAVEQDLTYTGRLIQVAVRITGPLLLALTALSIRGRVKR